MSVVVAVKKEGTIYMGCDSQVTCGLTRSTLKNPNNFKIWKVKGVDHCLMAGVGYVRELNIVKVMNDLIPELAVIHREVNFDFVVSYLVPRILDEFKNYNIVDDGPTTKFIKSQFLFAYEDQLFQISSDGSVIEIEDEIAIGSGDSEALGSLSTVQDNDPKDKVIKSLKATLAHNLYTGYPIILINNKDMEFEVLEENGNAHLIKEKRNYENENYKD